MKRKNIATALKRYVSRVGDLHEFGDDLRDPDLAANYAIAERAAVRAAKNLAEAINDMLIELPPAPNETGQSGLQDLYTIVKKLRKGTAL